MARVECLSQWGRIGLTLAGLVGIVHGAQAASVNLAWDYTQGTDPAVGFNMYRAPGTCAGVFAKLNASGVIPVATLLYTDTAAVAGSTYCWKVTAVNATGGEAVDITTGELVYTVPVPLVLNPPTHLRVLP